jgi:hypothetical protein
LTTFAEVPWNAPYYLRCGFEIVPESLLTPGLHEIRRAEAAQGLVVWPRVCMSRALRIILGVIDIVAYLVLVALRTTRGGMLHVA